MTQNVRLERPWGNGRIVWVREGTIDDSDKSFTVPVGKMWALISVRLQITCSADVGNRVLSFTITDGTNVVYNGPRTGSITATQTGVLMGAMGLASTATTGDLPLETAAAANAVKGFAMPPLYLPEAYVLRCYDTSAIAAAADDLIVTIHYIEYDT